MTAEFDFVVVGSGAGGGPLACRLAQDPAGYRVALVEAGGDPAVNPDGTENFNYSVPALHGRATEDKNLSWDFFVRHFTDDARQARDSKLYPQPKDTERDPRRKGVFYPRAGTLGGCTAHNALITIYPHNEDWDHVQELTGDASWSAEKMRGHFENLEDCRYAPHEPNSGRHGFGNWLSTSLTDIKLLKDTLGEESVQAIALAAVKTLIEDTLLGLKGAATHDRVKALIDRVRVYVDILKLHELQMPESQRNLLKSIDAMMNRPDVADRMAKLLKLFPPEVLRLPEGSWLDGVADALHAAPIDSLMNRFFEESLSGWSLKDIVDMLVRLVDPNDWRAVHAGLEGIFPIPLATDGVRRTSPRELIRMTEANCPYRLTVIGNSLVTRVVFEGTRAVGVRYVSAPNSYFASPLNTERLATPGPFGPEQEIRVRREVILAGGTFNTPQMLMLSGVGPKQVLDEHCIEPVGGRYWEGVGKNLQDRYEVAVISEMKEDFEFLKHCKFETPQNGGKDDPCFQEWQKRKAGLYTSNGALFSIIKRSSFAEHIVSNPPAGALPPPDLFFFGLLGFFKGYYPSYSQAIAERHNILTWALLKGHTRNNAGEVKLRSKDPRDTPLINFKSFDDGSVVPGSPAAKDADAIIEGLTFIKRMLDRTGRAVKVTAWPNLPLKNLNDPAKRAELREFVLNETWGHHACGTCKIGKDSTGIEQAVIDSEFRVHGLQGLRVVDASVFPRIPGFFIVTPIYMVSEKAAEVILAAARNR